MSTDIMHGQVETPAAVWAGRTRPTKFWCYLGTWLGVLAALDLLAFIVCKIPEDQGDLWIWLLILVLTIPGQLILAPIIAGILAYANTRIRPVHLVLPFLVLGLPTSLAVSWLTFSLVK